MRVLFVHQNFPGQFRHLSPLLAERGHEVVALTIQPPRGSFGARVVRTVLNHAQGTAHPWAQDFDTKIVRGEATLRTALALRAQGFVPDLILAHPGWGDTLFLKDVWPEARLVLYAEFFYGAKGADHDFDPEFAREETEVETRVRMRLRNVPQLLQLDLADAGLSPTRFQADTYPLPFRDRIEILHDGIDTAVVAPGPAATMRLPDGRRIAPGDEVVTFVSRALEPYRGIHTMLRAWPAIQNARPGARLAVVGGEVPGYGAAPPAGSSWKTLFLQEAGDAIDPDRILFLGQIDHRLLLNLFRLSWLHVYLTYPFVLSWSMLEAMAVGCAVLGSDTAPVREFISPGETGMLAPFLAPAELADAAIRLLADRSLRRRLGMAARMAIHERIDLRSVVQPRQLALVDRLMAAPAWACAM